jgi:hypothetical protein
MYMTIRRSTMGRIAVAFVAMATATIGIGVATTSSADAAPPPGHSWHATAAGLKDASIPKLADPGCAAGEKPLLPVAAGKTDDGGYVFEYNIDGIVNDVTVPPANFTPDTATADQLQEYGFPARPSDSAGLSRWRSRYATGFHGMPLPKLCQTDRTNAPAQAVQASSMPAGDSSEPIAGVSSTYNWAGYDGTSAENIDERPTYSSLASQYKPLTNFY